MALAIHVNGEARVYTGTGNNGALQTLGVSVDGVEIEFKLATEDVIVDTFGPKVPLDVQYFLEEAEIRLELVWYDHSVLIKVLARIGPGSGTGPTANLAQNTFGTMAAAGGLFLEQNAYTRLLVSSIPASQGVTAAEPCWNFPTAWLNDSDTFKVGTRRTSHRQTWRAIPFLNSVTGGPSTGSVLYNNVCS